MRARRVALTPDGDRLFAYTQREGLVLGSYGFVLACASGLRRVRLERLLRERPLVVLAPWHIEMLRARPTSSRATPTCAPRTPHLLSVRV